MSNSIIKLMFLKDFVDIIVMKPGTKIMFLEDYVDIKSVGFPVVVGMTHEGVILEGNRIQLGKTGLIIKDVPERMYVPLQSQD